MNCSDFVAELQTTLDESWEKSRLELTDSMREHAVVCSGCRARMQAALAVHGRSPEGVEVPAGLDEKIIAAVAYSRRRRPIRRVPLLAAAALLVVLTVTMTLALSHPGNDGTIVVHLVLEAPGASSVAVVGDWNGWDASVQRLTDPGANGVWEFRFRVQAGGEYEYQFVVDDEAWIHDPGAVLDVEDGFGGRNSVLDI